MNNCPVPVSESQQGPATGMQEEVFSTWLPPSFWKKVDKACRQFKNPGAVKVYLNIFHCFRFPNQPKLPWPFPGRARGAFHANDIIGSEVKPAAPSVHSSPIPPGCRRR